MFNKVSKIVFIISFMLVLTIPMITINLNQGQVSSDEKRALASFPSLLSDDGTYNDEFDEGFESWLNDNIGLRSEMIAANAKIQYYLFDNISDNKDMYLGPNGELNYATDQMLLDYQHNNLYSDSRLKEIADSFDSLKDYVQEHDAQFYYYQCWDKHSIYPEYFPDSVNQYGTESKTDQFVKAIKDMSGVMVISSKQELIDSKMLYVPYSKYGDATHWTQRGAYIGYLRLMDVLNANNGNAFRVLAESDYEITTIDQGQTLFGGIHFEDYLEDFKISEPKAMLTNNKLTLLNEDKRHKYYTNDSADNNTRLMIVGDSYFEEFLLDDLAESFHEVIMLWADYVDMIPQMMEEYHPDIVVLEAAERCDRTRDVIELVEKIKR